MNKKTLQSLILILALLIQLSAAAQADQLDNLRDAIRGREQAITEVDEEIEQLQVQVQEKTEERQTLQEVVDEIANQQAVLENKIGASESSIADLEAIIESISAEISALETEIANKKGALKNSLQSLQIADSDTLVEGFLKYDSLSQFMEQTDRARQLGAAIDDSMEEIRATRNTLEQNKTRQEDEKAEILALQQQVLIDKKSVDIARAEQERLLGITRSEESSYQALLEEKRQLRQAFEADLSAYEAQLNIALNPAAIPQPAGSTLSWPLANIVITQYFGNTAFAQSGAYNGSGHNGIDLDLEVGTPVLSARQGVVKGVGNTDAECPYASYGRWILIEHDNGLSSLYAHLSQSAVSPGQSVGRGEVIGYGGNTGYSTGSHLHFSVYASEGVRVGGLPSRSCPGTNITLPLADLSAYLNPIEYLP
jgi:murein DD-endopeptidase MepM/ murein hydrolase activator NlpD